MGEPLIKAFPFPKVFHDAQEEARIARTKKDNPATANQNPKQITHMNSLVHHSMLWKTNYLNLRAGMFEKWVNHFPVALIETGMIACRGRELFAPPDP